MNRRRFIIILVIMRFVNFIVRFFFRFLLFSVYFFSFYSHFFNYKTVLWNFTTFLTFCYLLWSLMKFICVWHNVFRTTHCREYLLSDQNQTVSLNPLQVVRSTLCGQKSIANMQKDIIRTVRFTFLRLWKKLRPDRGFIAYKTTFV